MATTRSRSKDKTADSQTKLSTAAKKTLQRRIRITIGLAHRKMVANALLEAVELFEEAEKSCLELGKDGEEILGEVHHNLAFCHESLGDRTLCKVHLSMALESRKKTVGIVDPDMASTMGYLATIANLEKDYKNAQFFARQALTTWDLVDHETTEEVLQANSTLGHACRAANEFTKAVAAFHELAGRIRPLLEKVEIMTSTSTAEAQSGKARAVGLQRRLVDCLKSLGEVYMESGEFEKAAETLEQAFEEASIVFEFDVNAELEKCPDPEPLAGDTTVASARPDDAASPAAGAPDLLLAEIKINLANAFGCLGKPGRSVEELQIAGAIYDSNFRGRVNYLGLALLHALGTANYRIQNLDGAALYYEEAIALADALGSEPARHLRLKSLRNLAVVKIELSQDRERLDDVNHMQRAHECLVQAATETSELMGAKTEQACMAFIYVGWAENQMKRYADSEATFEKALTIAGQATGYRSKFYADALLDTAHAYVCTGEI
eukprot:INCI10471.2.p1 GENE.INCI10471.2~~INCI10471.2.p1  ORF type:complete len:495 (+),score=111.46 INCI10471.2:240-1724(+)